MVTSSEFIRGYTEILVLAILSKKDSYVYDLVQTIEKLTDGQIVISNPSLLLVIRKMQDEKKVTSYEVLNEKGVPRKYYTLTNYGREVYENTKGQFNKSLMSMSKIIMGKF